MGPAVQQDSYVLRIVPMLCTVARQRHHRRACARPQRHLPRPAGTHYRQHRRLSADRHACLHRQYWHARRRLSHACNPCGRDRGFHAHQSGAPVSRQWPPGGRLCDRAHGRSRRRRARRRSRRTAAQELHCARGDARSATIGGSAVAAAAERIATKGKAIAAHLLNIEAADISFADGMFSSPKTNRTLTIKDVAKEAMEPTKLPKDMDVGLIATATYFAPVQNFPNGCHICELEVDQDTGEVEIVRYSVVDDVGTVINPLLLKGQSVGGVAQGIGQILMEDIRFNEEGQNLTGSFMDYAMPRATDISAVEVKSNPVPTSTNPLGVKGAGEAGCVGAMPAVANALVDALSHLGVRHVEMPATPERLWRAMRDGHAK